MVTENINVYELRSLVALKLVSKHEANRYVRRVLGLPEIEEEKKKPNSPLLPNPELVKGREKD